MLHLIDWCKNDTRSYKKHRNNTAQKGNKNNDVGNDVHCNYLKIGYKRKFESIESHLRETSRHQAKGEIEQTDTDNGFQNVAQPAA